MDMEKRKEEILQKLLEENRQDGAYVPDADWPSRRRTICSTGSNSREFTSASSAAQGLAIEVPDDGRDVCSKPSTRKTKLRSEKRIWKRRVRCF